MSPSSAMGGRSRGGKTDENLPWMSISGGKLEIREKKAADEKTATKQGIKNKRVHCTEGFYKI